MSFGSPLLVFLTSLIACGIPPTPEAATSQAPTATPRATNDAFNGNDSITVDLSGPDTVDLGEPVRMRVTLTNATSRAIRLTIYGDKLYWLYFVRSAEGWIRYAGGNETPLEKSWLKLDPHESRSLALEWLQDLTCCGGRKATPGLFYIEALPLISEPMDYRFARRLVIRPSR
jgi:hypothetical protein